MTAPPRPQWLWARKGTLPESAFIVEKAEVLQLRAYIEHLERELESCQAALDDLRREPETMWGPEL